MTETTGSSELWVVNVSAGQTRTMSLEQLDEAFNAGLVNEATMVCEVGSDLWQPLYMAAGLEPPRPTTPGSPAPPHSEAPPQAPPQPSAVSASAGPNNPATPSRLPSAKAPPLPANYMSATGSRGASTRPSSSGLPVSHNANKPGTSANAVPRPGAFANPGSSLGTSASAGTKASSAGGALPSLKATWQGPTPSNPPPNPVASNPALAARSKPPPLPVNAFAGSASQAPYDAMPPSSNDMPPPLSRAVAQVVEPRILPAQIPYNAPAPQITSNPPFANTAPQQAQAFGSSFATQSTSDSTAPQKKRARAELWIMALAGALGLVITLHRNAILFDVAAGLGAKSLYLQVEKSLLGEPSVDTPRGVQQLLQQSEHKGPSAR